MNLAGEVFEGGQRGLNLTGAAELLDFSGDVTQAGCREIGSRALQHVGGAGGIIQLVPLKQLRQLLQIRKKICLETDEDSAGKFAVLQTSGQKIGKIDGRRRQSRE